MRFQNNILFRAFRLLKSLVLNIIKHNPKEIIHIPAWIISMYNNLLRYILKRNLTHSLVQKKMPWIPYDAKKFLKSYLNKEMLVFEFGSGGSTLFFSKRVKKVISVEHDKNWFNLISNEIKNNNFNNIEYNFINKMDKYHKIIHKYPNNFFDLIFIDGGIRNLCVKNSIQKVKKNGVLMLDNSEMPSFRDSRELLKKYKRTDFVGIAPYYYRISQNSIWNIE